MIAEFVSKWETNKAAIRAVFESAHPGDYKAVVRAVIENVTAEDDWRSECPDPNRIHELNDGEYQGTLVYVIGAKGYQPSDYWYVRVSYGSYSGCDTLEAIRGYSDEKPTPDEVDQYMTLALHIVQGLKKMGGDFA